MLTQALLVDDSRSALDFLKRLIEADGLVQATAFLDPLQAIATARERDFDIVLVDYEMPKMDGITFIRELRSLPKFADIPIVMVTSIQTDEVRLKALEAGATDFLPKRPQAMEMNVRLRNLIKLGAAVRKLNNQAASRSEKKRLFCASPSPWNTATTTPASTPSAWPNTAASLQRNWASARVFAETSILRHRCMMLER